MRIVPVRKPVTIANINNSDPKVEITVGKGEIYFSHAECKDKLCVKSGKLTSGGETAACLPARVVISVKSNKNKTDIMTY